MAKTGLVTKKTRGLCELDMIAVEDSWVMLAKKLLPPDSEIPTRPLNARPTPRIEAVPASPTHLMLVRAPRPTPRSLAWARRDGAQSYDSVKLESMLRLERLNLG
jgi:hypothetical protein